MIRKLEIREYIKNFEGFAKNPASNFQPLTSTFQRKVKIERKRIRKIN